MTKIKTKKEISEELHEYMDGISAESMDVQIRLLKAKLYSTMLEKNSLKKEIVNLTKDPKNKYGRLKRELSKDGVLSLYNLKKINND